MNTNSSTLAVCTMVFIQTIFATEIDRTGCTQCKSCISDVRHLAKIQQWSDSWGTLRAILLLFALH